ncbi:hypothetical protein NST14_30545 [Bacillus sp. FSL W8-0519]|uniref:hypothetical protein n=1 Tax=Bacillus TaxID=1386 RepID=UPI000C281531|nr:hypothetical protein [Bacillus paranthracis]MCC2414056.1 hypothetical protein [Bacillus paranthracis]HDR7926314.1 hypothetical protein [Bacillus paranthracis]
MKLFMCYANAIDYDPTGLVVAESEEKAVEKYEQLLDDEGVWVASVHAVEITEVDGYKIELDKMDI